MAPELAPIDISDLPELVRLVEEVRSSNRPRLLRRDSEDLAMLVPVSSGPKRRGRKRKSQADLAAFRSSAGSWQGLVDVDRFLEDVYESRRSSRPPVELLS